MEGQKSSNNISRRDFLKLSGIFAGGIFTNLAMSTDVLGPIIELSEVQQQQEQDRITNQIKSRHLNSALPCSDRQALRKYLEENNYIREYTGHQRIQELPLDNSHKSQLNVLLEPIIHDDNNKNHAVYPLLHHLIRRQMRTLSFAQIDNSKHRQLIRQIEETIPHGSKPYTYHYVDPEIIALLDDENTTALLNLTYVNHSRSNHIITKHPDVIDTGEKTYELDGLSKYSYNHAKKLLKQHRIGLRSSSMGTKEVGNNRSSNRSSLVGINASSIDGIIALVQDVRQRWNYSQTEHITGGTELGIHKPGADGHEGGWKLDLGESLLILIILLEQGITKVGSYSNSIHIGDYEYIFNYHGPDRHLDILIKEIKKGSTINSHDSKGDTIPSKPRQKMIHRDLIRPKTSGPVA